MTKFSNRTWGIIAILVVVAIAAAWYWNSQSMQVTGGEDLSAAAAYAPKAPTVPGKPTAQDTWTPPEDGLCKPGIAQGGCATKNILKAVTKCNESSPAKVKEKAAKTGKPAEASCGGVDLNFGDFGELVSIDYKSGN